MVELELKHRLCFPFCQDLGNKKVYRALKGLDDRINLKWSLFRVKQHTTLLGGGGVGLPESDIIVPGNYSVERVKGDWTSAWGDPEYTTFIAPNDYYNNGKIFYDTKREFAIDLPKDIEEQPHLHKHSTFLFSYLKNDIVSCSCQFLDCENGKIKIEILVSASPSGTYLIWVSGVISFKWKIEIRQDIVVMNLMKEHLKDMWNTSKKIGKGVLKFASMGAIDLDDKDMGGVIEKMATEAGGKDHWKKMGLDKEKIQRNQEKQIQRMATSTIVNEATLEPPVLASEAVHLPYNLFDYGLRSVFKPHWEYRIYVSENLLNNLIHNNNENPITYPLNITFQKFGSILRKGYWQGKLKLAYDPDGNMAKCFARGVYFFEDMEKDFPNPNLDIKSLINQGGLTGFGGDYYQAEEIKEWVNTDIPFDYRPEAKGYGHSTYLTIDNSSVRNNEWKNLNWNHWDNNKGWCWGCTQQTFSPTGYSGSAHDPNSPACPPFADKMVGKFTPSQNCNFEGKFHVDGSNTHYEPLQAGTEYEIWVNHTKLWFRYLKSSGVRLQKDPRTNDFDNMDWTPPPGSGGDTEIPLNEPDLGGIDPETNPDIGPEPDFVPEADPSGPGEPEITPLEPDITVDTDPFDPDGFPDIDPPPVEVDPPFDTDPPKDKDHDTSRDTGDKDPPKDDDEKPEDFD